MWAQWWAAHRELGTLRFSTPGPPPPPHQTQRNATNTSSRSLIQKEPPTLHAPTAINFPLHSHQRIRFQTASLPTAEINHN